MGLSKKSGEKAFAILKEVVEVKSYLRSSVIQEFNEKDKHREDYVIGFSPNSAGEWENIFTDIRDITQAQIDLFEALSTEIGNTSFITAHEDKDNKSQIHKFYVEKGFTRIGWI